MFDADFFNTVINALLAMSGWEVLAAVLGVIYVVLAARELHWCWIFAFVSTAIYTWLFWGGPVPMQAVLNFYYMGMAIYGFFLWQKKGAIEDDLLITSWSLRKQLGLIMLAGGLTYIVGIYLSQYQVSKNPYLDAGVTVFSVLNTWLMAKKVIQNWLNWMAIDTAAIVLYTQNEYYATVVMYIVYLFLSVAGFMSWRKLYRQQQIKN